MKKTLLSLTLGLMGLFTAQAYEVNYLDRTGWNVTPCSEDSREGNGNGYARCILDDNVETYWHSNWDSDVAATNNHWFVLDMGAVVTLDGFDYWRRQNNQNGQFYTGKAYVSEDAFSFQTGDHDAAKAWLENAGNVTAGEFSFTYDADANSVRRCLFPESVTGRYLLVIITNSGSNNVGKHACCGEFKPFSVERDKLFDVTVNYTLNGRVMSTGTYTVMEGDEYTLTVPAFTAAAEGVSLTGTYSKANSTINIRLVEQVPFVTSTDVNNLVWQGVTAHSNMHWALKYTADDSAELVVNPPTNRHKANQPFVDAELWAFVGNVIDGYTIYNKAAGTEKWLYTDGTNAKVGTSTENKVFSLLASGAVTNTAEACCFRIAGQNPLNAQGTQLKLNWSAPDEGSTFMFYSLADPMLNYYADHVNAFTNNLPEGIVGSYIGSIEEEVAALAAVKAEAEVDPYSAEKAAAFSQAMINFENAERETLAFDPAKFYRLENLNYHGYAASHQDELKAVGVAEGVRTNPHNLIKFEAVPEADQQYYVYSQGLYFGHSTIQANGYGAIVPLCDKAGDRGTYQLVANTGASHEFFIKDMSSDNPGYNCLHQSGTADLVGWDTGAVASKWYLHPAEDLDMTLTQQYDNKYVGTGYFPFPVVAADGAKLYYIHEATSKTDDTTPVMTYAEVATVPANTAFVVMSEVADVTLTIAYDAVSAQADEANVLAGTLRKATAATGDYVFNGSAFEKSAEAPAIGSNSAWIPATAVKDAAVQSFALVDPTETSAIDEVVVNNGVAEVYDLQGRRVSKASKGLYIINGKKVLVK